jgi:hypothetical protein
MAKKNLLKITLALVGIIVFMTACTGGSQSADTAQQVPPTPTLVVVGSTIEKPVPFGYDIILKNIVISINEINRASDDLITQSGAEIPTPSSGQEYLLIRITNQCIATETATCFVGHRDFFLMDSDGNAVSPLSEVSGAEGFYTYEEFSRGTSNRGFLAFLVEKDVDYPILTYNSFTKGSVYLSLVY